MHEIVPVADRVALVDHRIDRDLVNPVLLRGHMDLEGVFPRRPPAAHAAPAHGDLRFLLRRKILGGDDAFHPAARRLPRQRDKRVNDKSEDCHARTDGDQRIAAVGIRNNPAGGNQ